MPLYIYPLTPATWEPLHHAISAHPNLNFVIVLNPNSGPGVDWQPDECYAAEILRLNAQTNVRAVGYVRIDYCRRPLHQVNEDIAKYAGWSQHAGLGVQGIFFDETPNLYSAHVAGYLDAVNQTVKKSTGIGGRRLVIHNPGTIPEPGLAAPGPDVTAVVEEGYAKYQSAPVQERLAALSNPHYDWNRSCFIVHSVPAAHVGRLVCELRQRGAYIFVTERRRNFYEAFGETWAAFVETMDANA